VAAGYAVYGPSTMLVLTGGPRHARFTLDREVGSFVLTGADLRIPEETKEFAINMSNHPPLGSADAGATSTTCWPARPARAARISTCAGWRAWSPTCTAS
jgi:hypothetical protein